MFDNIRIIHLLLTLSDVTLFTYVEYIYVSSNNCLLLNGINTFTFERKLPSIVLILKCRTILHTKQTDVLATTFWLRDAGEITLSDLRSYY